MLMTIINVLIHWIAATNTTLKLSTLTCWSTWNSSPSGIFSSIMERKSAPLAWPFSYFSNSSMAHNHLQEAPDSSLDGSYALSLSSSHMAADRSGFLAPCYWPPHYSTPYGVGQPASNQHGKRGGTTSSCECTTCVTSPTLPYKPFFMAPQDTRRSEATSSPLYPPRDARQPLRAASNGNDTQSLKPQTGEQLSKYLGSSL